jgi:hypothetical protein
VDTLPALPDVAGAQLVAFVLVAARIGGIFVFQHGGNHVSPVSPLLLRAASRATACLSAGEAGLRRRVSAA